MFAVLVRSADRLLDLIEIAKLLDLVPQVQEPRIARRRVRRQCSKFFDRLPDGLRDAVVLVQVRERARRKAERIVLRPEPVQSRNVRQRWRRLSQPRGYDRRHGLAIGLDLLGVSAPESM